LQNIIFTGSTVEICSLKLKSLKKSIVILFHAAFWLCYFFLIIVILGLFYGDDKAITTQVKNSDIIRTYYPNIKTGFSFQLLASSIMDCSLDFQIKITT